MTRKPKFKISALLLASTMAVTGLPATQAAAGIDEYIGELMLVGFLFCPRGSTEANGQLLPISQNTALFSLYGTTYGGDGRTTFGLPDLRGRAAIHTGQGAGLQNYAQGQRGGAENFTLTTSQMPAHNHPVNANNELADKGGPDGKFLAAGESVATGPKKYHDGPADKVMNSGMIGNTGGNAQVPHRGPYLTMRYCVVLQGVFPSRN